MKKIVILALLIFAMCFTMESQAQVRFGLKGGLNVTDMSFSKRVFATSDRAGFYIGPTIKFTLPVIGLGVDASALYDQREAKLDNTETVKQQAINIPINLRYNIGLGDLAAVYFAAGPQFGFNVGDDEFKWTKKADYQNIFQFKKSNFSINLGAGVSLVKHLEVGFSYNIVCGKTADVDVWETVGSTVKDKFKGRSNSWQIGLAYYF